MTSPRNKTNVSIVNPVVHLLGEDAAAIAYIKVTQSIDKYVVAQVVDSCITEILDRREIVMTRTFFV